MPDASSPAPAETPAPLSAADPSAATPASVPAPSAGGGPSSVDPALVEAHDRILKSVCEDIDTIARKSDIHNTELATLGDRITAVQSTLSELDTPQNAAAVEVVLDALTKPGRRTTEFWLNLLGAVGVLGLAAGGVIPGTTAAYVTLAGAALYTLARLALKGKAADLANKTLALLVAAFCMSSLTG